jgi:hypothetical protein
VQIDAPVFVTQSVAFGVSTGMVNSSTVPLAAITATIALTEYVDSTEPILAVTPVHQVVTDVAAGETVTVTWSVVPLVAGSGIPLRVSAQSGGLFAVDEHPLVVNEQGTLPDLTLNGVCGSALAGPGEEVSFWATVLDEELAPMTDPTTVVTASIMSAPAGSFSAGISLPYCEECEAFEGVLVLPGSAPIGSYRVDYRASHPDYDPTTTTGHFFVTPPLTVTLSMERTGLGVSDPLTITVEVTDRGSAVDAANVWAVIVTPGGTITAPMEFNGLNGYVLSFRPSELGADLGGSVLPGDWAIEVEATYQGGMATESGTISVIDAAQLSELTIEKSGSEAILTWPHLGSGIDRYEVYRASSPYLPPDDPGSQKLSDVPPPVSGSDVVFADSTAFELPLTSYFYTVAAIDADGRVYTGDKQTGTYHFMVVPGD